jgi:hypothetical protein
LSARRNEIGAAEAAPITDRTMRFGYFISAFRF